MEKRRTWQNLIAVFISLKDEFRLADIQLKKGIDAFCIRLETESIVHSSKNTSGTVWRAKSLIACFCETFDPILIQIFPQDFYTYDYLNRNQIRIPLTSHLVKKESCGEFADNIKYSITELEKLIPIGNISDWPHIIASPSDWPRIQKDTESLELLAQLFLAMYEELDLYDEVNWCSICFRLANRTGNYCDLHSTTQDDTNYRQGLRIKESITKEDQGKFLRLHSKRKALKDDLVLLSNPTDIPSEITHKTNCIYIDEVTKNLVQDTLSEDWQFVSKDWAMVLQTVPFVNKRLNIDPSIYLNWHAFVESILASINNQYENTRHPYWILLMLAEAEIWFSIEDRFLQNKTNQKKDQIIKLLTNGLRNRDIVNQLDVANSYVSQLRKEYNKNRTEK